MGKPSRFAWVSRTTLLTCPDFDWVREVHKDEQALGVVAMPAIGVGERLDEIGSGGRRRASDQDGIEEGTCFHWKYRL